MRGLAELRIPRGKDLRQAAQMPDVLVEQIMRTDHLTVYASLPIDCVHELMLEEGTGTALVINDNEDLVGLIDRAAVEATREEAATVEDLPDGFFVEAALDASDVMTPYVQVARPWWPADRARQLMSSSSQDAVPVVIEGDTKAVGVVTREDLDRLPDSARRMELKVEPFGTFRSGVMFPTAVGADRRELMERAEEVAEHWLLSPSVDADDPTAETYAGVMLPILSELQDALIEHYSDLQESVVNEAEAQRPELLGFVERLRERQGDALDVLAMVMQQIRNERRPDRDGLRRVSLLVDELRSIEAVESDLYHELYFVDVPAAD